MKLYTLIVDDFLDNFDIVRNFAVTRDYTGITNPEDGVFYPDINIQIPNALGEEIAQKVGNIMGGPIQIRYAFFRLSKEGTFAPHQVHTDHIMGEYGIMIYMQDGDENAGTTILEHVNGIMKSRPKDDAEFKIWQEDTNVPEAWNVVSAAQMKANRAFFIRGDVFHRSEPVGGFGDSPENGRIVLVVFYDVKGTTVYG